MVSLYYDIVILVIIHFGFEGGTLVLIAYVPGHCLSFTFNTGFGFKMCNSVLTCLLLSERRALLHYEEQ